MVTLSNRIVDVVITIVHQTSVSVSMNVKHARLAKNYASWVDISIQSRKERWAEKRVPSGLTPEIVRDLNKQGIPDKEISIMYDRSFTYVGKLKKKWESEGNGKVQLI